MWVPFVKVNQALGARVKRAASVGQCPPVCSSVNWQARKVGTVMRSTKVRGASGSATSGS